MALKDPKLGSEGWSVRLLRPGPWSGDLEWWSNGLAPDLQTCEPAAEHSPIHYLTALCTLPQPAIPAFVSRFDDQRLA